MSSDLAIRLRPATHGDMARLTTISRDAFADAEVESRLHPRKEKYPEDYYRTNYTCFMTDLYAKDTVIVVAETEIETETETGPQRESQGDTGRPAKTIIVGWATWKWDVRDDANKQGQQQRQRRPEDAFLPDSSFIKRRIPWALWTSAFRTALRIDRSADGAFHRAREEGPETSVASFRARDHPRKWILDWLVVDPQYQGQRVGQTLVEWGMKRCDRDESALVLTAWPATNGFFEKMGFTAYRYFEVESFRWWMFGWLPGWKRSDYGVIDVPIDSEGIEGGNS